VISSFDVAAVVAVVALTVAGFETVVAGCFETEAAESDAAVETVAKAVVA
jgi:hypothetical protein